MSTKSHLLVFLILACCSVALGLFEEDIALTPEQQATLEYTSNPADPFAPQNAVVRNQRSLWPNGVIPYMFDDLNSAAMGAIRDAMDDFNTQTCIRFVERTTESDYVRFFAGAGCYSFIGRIGGPQDISIGSGCEFKGIVIHEIFHALGRWHEQSRPDRDSFVRILSSNIRSGTENNFDIISASFATTQGVPYDLGSVMHYRSTAFSINGQPTILPIDPNIPASSLGQRNGFSMRDLQHVMALYCPGDSSTGSWSSWTAWSDCSRTCNGGSRVRTRSCVGGVRCDGNNVESEQCNTESCSVPPSWGSWSSWSDCSESCGGGRQRRTRSCEGGNTCVGIMNEFRNCNTQDCPQSATWGSWGSWSTCSRTCQGGVRQRNRLCQNGNSCSGSNVETGSCNENISCTAEPITIEWSSWSACSAECGGGERFRMKICSDNNCNTTQIEECNTEDCNPEPELMGLKYRGCWYLNTRAGIIGTLEGHTTDLSDNPLSRVKPVRKCGEAALKYNYRLFALTLGGYCLTGSNTLSDYTYYPSRLCEDGRGGSNRGWYLMDVYEVTNQRSFSDSAQISSSTVSTLEDFTNNNGSTTEAQNSGFKVTISVMTILLTFLLAFVAQ